MTQWNSISFLNYELVAGFNWLIYKTPRYLFLMQNSGVNKQQIIATLFFYLTLGKVQPGVQLHLTLC